MIHLPEVPVTTFHYRPGLEVPVVEPTYISDLEAEAMEEAHGLALEALEDGNPPVGSVLIHNITGERWPEKTSDISDPDIMGHAEVRSYRSAKQVIGRDMSDCTLVTTAQPCTSCTPPYAEGKISKIIYAAPRPLVWAIINNMRPRLFNMPELLFDGQTDTVVTEGFMAARSLELFVEHARKINRPEKVIQQELDELPVLFSQNIRFILDDFVLTGDGKFVHQKMYEDAERRARNNKVIHADAPTIQQTEQTEDLARPGRVSYSWKTGPAFTKI